MAKNPVSKRHGAFEHSAGGVVFRRHNNNLQILLIKDKNGIWSFPKGLIEKDEDIIKTAQREIAEEASIHNVTFVDEIDSIGYYYRFGGNLIRKKVDFFLFEYKDGEEPHPQIQEGIQDAKWIESKEALAIIGYVKTNKPILEKAIETITSNN